MNIERALEHVFDITSETDQEGYIKLGYNKKLAELVLWAYEQGWVEGLEDLRKEQDEI